jgi:hypothetical protein
MAEFAAKEAASVLERFHALFGHVAVADDRDEDLRALEIVRDFDARDRHEAQPWILELGRDQARELALQLGIDPSHPFTFHRLAFRTVLNATKPEKREHRDRTKRTIHI